MLAALAILICTDIAIFQGGLSVAKAGTIPQRARMAAPKENSADAARTKNNLKVGGLKFSPADEKNAPEFFRKGEKIKISCAIKNESQAALKNFRALIRTPNKEIAAETVKKLNPQKEFELSGDFTPETEGLFIVACRGDSGKQIAESDENDNREAVALHVSK